MSLIIKRILILVLLLAGVVHGISQAATIVDQLPKEDAVNRQPWQSYQQIDALLQQGIPQDRNDYLWLLLRKAQAENLLYFHQQFADTVTQAQAMIDSLTPTEITSTFNIYAGIVNQRKGLYKEAIEVFNTGLKQAKEGHLTRLYIYGKEELAYTRSLIELYESSLNEIQEAYVEAFALDDQFLIACINETYGAIYGYMGDYDKSVEYYQKALIAYQRLGFPSHIAEAIYGLAATYRYWKKYDLAIDYFNQYQQKISYTPNKDISFFAAYGLGMTLAEQGSCDQALPVIDRALKLNGQIDYNAELYKRQAECYVQLGQLDAADQALAQAGQIFNSLQEIEGTTWQLEVKKIAAKIAHARGDDAGAYPLLQQYYQHYVELLEKNSSKRLLNVRSLLEVERRDVEIALLQQRAKVQSLKMAQEQQHITTQRYIIIFTVLLVTLIVIFMVVQYRNNRKILALSIRDPLSNLYNRRYVSEYLAKLIDNLDPDKGELAVLLLDIDDFKPINDRYGHSTGDKVIQDIAKIGQDTLRNEDVMSRIGGDEFLCVLPRANEQQCLQVAKRMLKNLSEHRFVSFEQQEFSVTVSIGIAYVRGRTLSAEQLFNRVDRAMYQAKRQGKSQISWLDGHRPQPDD